MSGPRIYNPAQLGGDELEKSFVVRQETLADLLRTIRAQAADSPCQHTLLIGPRGMGKTTMGLMCLRRVEQDPALAALWQPVPFHEESYGIGDLADLWLTALRHLAHATGDSQWAEKADALVAGEPDANRQAAYALAALLDFHQESGKRLLLFIENLDQVLAQIGDERQIHALRAALIQHPELLLLGSANTVFNAIRSHSHPFYEFFRLVFLRELDADETRLLLMAAVGEQSREDFQDAIDAETGRLETIRRQTRGNPRLLKLACQMMVVESPLGTALEDLERLIDEQTPYFKGRIEELPPQLRRVFHCLAEGWEPLLAKEVAATSKLSSSHASAQLRQLVDKGYAEEHRLPTSKRVYYQVVDRFYNIYYLLRLSHRSRGRFERLLQFLQDLFGVVGMRTLYKAALSELREGTAAKERRDLISVLAEHVAGDRDFGGRAGWMREATKVAGHTVIAGWCRKGTEQVQTAQFKDAAVTFGDVLAHARENANASDRRTLFALVGRVVSLFYLKRYGDIANDEYAYFAEAAQLTDDELTRSIAASYFLICGLAVEALDGAAEAVDMWTRCADLICMHDPSSSQVTAVRALVYVAYSYMERDQLGEAVTITRRAWEYDWTDVPRSVRRQMVMPLTMSAIWLLKGSEVDLGKARSGQKGDLTEAERYARRAWKYNPKDAVVVHVLSDVLARQGRWEESLTHLEEAARRAGAEAVLGGRGFAASFVRALAAGHASRVKDIMASTALAEPMEPLWHATCVELGEEIGPLPAEIADAVAAVRAEVEAVRAELGHGRDGKRSGDAADRLLEP